MKVKWLVYTVLVGLIPITSRVLIWLVAETAKINLLSAAEFIAFGLVLHISIINEIEHLDDGNRSWKTTQNGFSFVFIAIYGVMFALSIFAESGTNVVNGSSVITAAVIMSIASFLLCFSVYHRLEMIGRNRS